MSGRLDAAVIEHEIAALRREYPDIDDDERLWADMIEAATDAHEFLSALVRRIGTNSALVEGIERYIGELDARKARLLHRVERLRRLAYRLMTVAKLPTMTLAEATLSVRDGTPKVVIVDETVIPDEFMKRVPSKSRIAAAIKAGESVPGAHLSNAEPVLNIRIR